ncbi:MAG: nucleoside deaminase [Bacteroidia bacterium]|nr:nucleoside deaminase [Bacteroidia bacterium]
MNIALQQAQLALDQDEVPIGAIVVANNKVIGKGFNQTEILRDVTAHAEMIAITAASNAVGSKYLSECTLYVSIEPCLMCAGALAWSRISKVVYGASEPKFGYSLTDEQIISSKTEIVQGVLQEEAASLMTEFFKSKRQSKRS